MHMNTHTVNKNIALYIALSLYCPVDDLGCKLTVGRSHDEADKPGLRSDDIYLTFSRNLLMDYYYFDKLSYKKLEYLTRHLCKILE